MSNDIKEKMTTLNPSVGADEGQSPLFSKSIVAEIPQNDNHPDQELEEMEVWFRKMSQMNSLDHLHTVSLTELYDTVYQSRMPVIK